MKIEAIKFAKILKLAGEIAETLGYGEDGLQFLGWAETPGGDINITLTEKGDESAIVFIMPKPKEEKNESI
ncbi:hypothetical protein V6W59_03115 [Mannheimia sp. HC-2023]|uniref:hypothetical protein n=1 Tax=Mannheimia indoligenes TaxID=3103145 RepID=UPI002FE52F2C